MSVEIATNTVHLEGEVNLTCDVLIVATGAVLATGQTEGLTGAGWMEKVFTFYNPEGTSALGAALATCDGGRLVVNIVEMPIECPVSPVEFCFLADWYLHQRGLRDRVEMSFVTSLDAAITKPITAAHLAASSTSGALPWWPSSTPARSMERAVA